MSKQLKGDIDNDGKITILDSTICLHIMATEPIDFTEEGKARADVNDFTEEEKARADVNNDGTVSLRDAKAILRHIAGIELIDGVIVNGI